ncbi:MAG: anthranilate synthase component I family protein [Finegoldia sp.]|nr:anthranilate synthase component I family protein [Finegoldia sp.]
MIHSKKIDSTIRVEDLLYKISDKRLPFILDSGKKDLRQGNKTYLGFDPEITLKFKDGISYVEGLVNKEIKANPIDVLKDLMKDYFTEDDRDFIGGAVGYLSYDFINYNNKIALSTIENVDIYDAYFGIYFKIIEYDTHSGTYTIHYLDDTNIGELEGAFYLDKTYEKKTFESSDLIKNVTKVEYAKSFFDTKKLIEEGWVYEINLTQQFMVETQGDAYSIYRDLRVKNKADFMAYMDFGDYQILSSSPERFFKIKDRKVEVKPIKGTIRKSDDPVEDEALKNKLLNSEKDISELLMIVDLMRNDLSMSCDYESVRTIHKYSLETYENVHHLVATIVGILRDDQNIYDFLKKAFPGGSITGAPKIAAMEAIDQVEKYKRNIYTGSLGYISFNENSDFNILIRSILKKDKACYFSGGGAITWESDLESEYEESIQKVKKIIEVFK